MGEQIARFSEVRALIFDLDGTLIDSKLDLALAVNAALEEMGRGPLPHEQIFSYVGQGAPSLIAHCAGRRRHRRGMPARSRILHPVLFHPQTGPHTLYPGVRETLDALSGMSMAVLTNKPVGASRGILQGLGLAGHFRIIYGGNSFERKKAGSRGRRNHSAGIWRRPRSGDGRR